jgi:proline iminopeptidase
MKKRIIIVLTFSFLLITAVFSQTSLYSPGKLSQDTKLKDTFIPPDQKGIEEHFWKVEDKIVLYHFSQGEGKPVLIIHGGPGLPPYSPWQGLASVKGYSFTYYHQRGCGNSTQPVDKFESQNFIQNISVLNRLLGIKAQLADIERIRHLLRQDKLIIIGHSYGAFLATLYAFEFPEQVEKLVLISPADVLTLPSAHGGMDQMRKYLSLEEQKEFDAFLKEYFNYGTIFQKNEEELAGINSGFAKFYAAALDKKGVGLAGGTEGTKGIGGWMVHALYLSLGMNYDLKEYLKKISAPVLVVHGARDIQSEIVGQEYATLVQEGIFKVIVDASHFAFDERPEEFASLIRDFFSH